MSEVGGRLLDVVSQVENEHPRWMEVVRMRIDDEMTWCAIGKEMGVCKERARQIYHRCIRRLAWKMSKSEKIVSLPIPKSEIPKMEHIARAMVLLEKNHPRWAMAIQMKVRGCDSVDIATALNVSIGRARRILNRGIVEMKKYIGTFA